jgi:hypothetical protein
MMEAHETSDGNQRTRSGPQAWGRIGLSRLTALDGQTGSPQGEQEMASLDRCRRGAAEAKG